MLHDHEALQKGPSIYTVFWFGLSSTILLVGLFSFYISPRFELVQRMVIEDQAEKIALYTKWIGTKVLLGEPPPVDDIEHVMESFNLLKLKIFSPSGMIVYSTDSSETGEINSKSYFREFVAKGKTYIKLVTKAKKTAEGKTARADVAEIYIPFMENDHFSGAYELYIDISSLNALQNHTLLLCFAVILSTSGILLFCLWFLLRRLSSSMKRLRSTSKHLLTIIDSIQDPFLVINKDFKIILANTAARKLNDKGIIPPDMSCFQLSHKQDAACNSLHHTCPVPQVLKTRKPVSLQHIHYSADHVPIRVEVLAAPIFDENDEVIEIIEFARDITEQVETEEKLRESEEQFRSITENAADGIVGMDDHGLITIWNRSAARIFGYAEEEVIGGNLHDLLSPGDFKERIGKGLKHFAGKGIGPNIGRTVELVGQKKDGAEIPIELSLSSFRKGNTFHATAIVRDITNRKKIEQEIQNAKKQLENTNLQLQDAIERANTMAREAELANIAKSEFLANMSHEIRTPMNGVLGMTKLLLKTDLQGKQLEYGRIIEKSAESLLAIINDILDFSKIDAGRLELESIPFHLETLIDDTTEILGQRANEKDIELISVIDHNVPLAVKGDLARLRQVLINLIGNAVKFTTVGEVIIRVNLLKQQQEKAFIKFSISDTGIGIPEDKLQSLFQPFFQQDSSTTRKYGGTGLGLTISQRLVNVFGGSIEVRSEVGKGSTFNFTIPLIIDPKQQKAPHQKDAKALENKHILIAEKCDGVAESLAAILFRWKCRIDRVTSLAEALQAVHRMDSANDPYHIVIINPTGQEINTIAATISAASIKPLTTGLIILSSLDSRPKAFRELSNRPLHVEILTKPLSRKKLLSTARKILDRKQHPAGAAAEEALSRQTQPVTKLSRDQGKILLAEDNFVNQQVVEAILHEYGYSVKVATTGQQAVDAVRQDSFDLILMDCQMPEKDGYEATKEIHCLDDEKAGIPIIAMTANAMAGDREKCLAAGMDDYISKPIILDHFMYVIRKWLAANHNQEETPPMTQERNINLEDKATVFDYNGLLKRLMNNKDIVRKLITAFIQTMPLQFDFLEKALKEQKADEVRLHAHSIKGAAANLSAERLRKTAFKVEIAAKDGKLGDAASYLGRLRQDWITLKKILEEEDNSG